VEAAFRRAWRRRRGQRQAGDGRAFWSPVVAEALDLDDARVFERLYAYYATPQAWWVDQEALRVLGDLSRQGVRLGILSNWDTRLRELYHRFALDRLFPYLFCSAEHGLEKPDERLFRLACRVAGVRPREAVHIGDDVDNDVVGASRAGLVGLRYDDEVGWLGVERELTRLRRAPGWFARG
jgi:HAD superfamily hydrolase (TIGR01549 family)